MGSFSIVLKTDGVRVKESELLMRQMGRLVRLVAVWVVTAVTPLSAGWTRLTMRFLLVGLCPSDLVLLQLSCSLFESMSATRRLLAVLLIEWMMVLLWSIEMFAALRLMLTMMLLVMLRVAVVVIGLLMILVVLSL